MADPDQPRPTGTAPQTDRDTGQARGPTKLGVYDRPQQPAWKRPLPIVIALAVIIALIILIWAFTASAGGSAVAMMVAAALPREEPTHGRQDHRRAL